MIESVRGERASTQESLRGEEILWKGSGVELHMPQRPAIPLVEGVHLQVVTAHKQQADWRELPLHDLLKQAYFSLPAARVVSDSGRTDDLWANIQWNSRPGFLAGANVFGRHPLSVESWGKPVRMRAGCVGHEAISAVQSRLQPLVGRYLPAWQTMLGEVELFRDGVGNLASDSPEFQQLNHEYQTKPSPWQERVLWANSRFVLVVARSPHLTGMHLVIHPRKEYWLAQDKRFRKPWQSREAFRGDFDHIEGFLESVAVLHTAQQVLRDKKPDFANPEVHYSGNWGVPHVGKGTEHEFDAEGYRQVVQAGDLRALRNQKRRYDEPSPEAFRDMNMHGHLYATSDPSQFVALPTRPLTEVPQQWEVIEPTSDRAMDEIQALLKDTLTSQIKL